MTTYAARTIYSEHEAAEMLDITVEELRLLVKNHITRDEELPEDACAALKPTDLLLLKLLRGGSSPSSAAAI
jgi:hypothetical protein